MNTKITVQTTVNADVKKVWDYYNQPEHITKWNFADPSWCCPSATNDLRPGGKYSARMEAKDGSFGFDFEGIYSEVEEGKSLIFGLEDGRQVAVSFKEDGDQTDVVITFDAETEHSEEMQRGGWQAILDNFKKYTETN
ncbi:MAG: SRPBCC family protein [Bacteroidota bacterium]